MHNLLTVKETAKYLRIPLPTVYYLVQRGQLPAIQIGGRWRIKKNALDKDILKEEKSGQPTVLVVDDDESLQNLFKLFLKKIGFSRVVVGTVKEAIAALEKQKFDLGFEKAAQDRATATNGENSWAQRRGQTRRIAGPRYRCLIILGPGTADRGIPLRYLQGSVASARTAFPVAAAINSQPVRSLVVAENDNGFPIVTQILFQRGTVADAGNAANVPFK